MPEIAEREAKETIAVLVHLSESTRFGIVRGRESRSFTCAGDRRGVVDPRLCRASE